VFIMVLLAELMVFVYTLASSTLPVFNWELLATSSLFVLWVVMLSAALLCWLAESAPGHPAQSAAGAKCHRSLQPRRTGAVPAAAAQCRPRLVDIA
jgi:hypothetical protein